MTSYLRQIRAAHGTLPLCRRVLSPLAAVLAGGVLGVMAKLLDIYTVLLGDIFSQFSVWVLLGGALAVTSHTSRRAALHVFAASAAMLAGYYVTAHLTGSVYSRTFVYGWSAFCLLSPLFAAVAWYAGGRGWPARILAGGIVLVTAAATVVLFDHLRWYDFLLLTVLAAVLRLCPASSKPPP